MAIYTLMYWLFENKNEMNKNTHDVLYKMVRRDCAIQWNILNPHEVNRSQHTYNGNAISLLTSEHSWYTSVKRDWCLNITCKVK